MRIAVSNYSYYRYVRTGEMDIPGFIAEAKKAGADGVELLAPFYKNPKSDREAALLALSEASLPCPIFSVSQNFAKKDPAERSAELEKIRFGISEAQAYGATVVRVFAGDVGPDVTFEEARSWIIDGLAAASVDAAVAGIRLALENHGKLAGTGEQVRGIILDVRAKSGVDALWANPDTGNFLLVDQPSHEAIRQVANFAAMVHFKDFAPEPEGHKGFAYDSLSGKRYVGTSVGEGSVELAACIAILRASGFDGWLSIEYEGEEDPIIAVPRSVAAARQLL
jgi:sugar phosphate isomerase/epimerase